MASTNPSPTERQRYHLQWRNTREEPTAVCSCHEKTFDTNISLGRSKESDLVIGDTLLSRKHARIIFKEEKWYIEDLKSSNGTWIGAKQIIELQEIENYQRIRAGNSLFEIVFKNGDEYNGKIENFQKQGYGIYKKGDRKIIGDFSDD